MRRNPAYDSSTGKVCKVHREGDLRAGFGTQTLAQHTDSKLRRKFLPAQEMRYDASKDQITACIDGYSQWLAPPKQIAADKEQGYRIAVAADELQPTLLQHQVDTSTDKQDKLYFMCITLPGYGVLTSALMSSGSKMRSGTARGKTKFWFERINELKLVYSDEQSRLELEQELKQRTWPVRLPPQLHCNVSVARCALSVHSTSGTLIASCQR